MNHYFIICERDAGLFSLIQQVIANIPRALNECVIPIVFFGKNCSYWIPGGYQGKDNVWEYYFEPIIQQYGSEKLCEEVRTYVAENLPDAGSSGGRFDQYHYLTSNFGDHSALRNLCLQIPFEWRDPDIWLRRVSSQIIERFLRPRQFLRERTQKFVNQHFNKERVIGVHIRGTDALSPEEPRLFRKNSLKIERYIQCIDEQKQNMPGAKVFVATDSQNSLLAIKRVYGSDVISYASIMHTAGPVAGKGPTGALMPSYFADDPTMAVENGAEAVVDYLILRHCTFLIHNGASLARTVLLSEPDMPHINTHWPSLRMRLRAISLTPYTLRRKLQKCEERLFRKRKIRFQQWQQFLKKL